MKLISLVSLVIVFACVVDIHARARPQFPFDSLGRDNPLASYLSSIMKSVTGTATGQSPTPNTNRPPSADSGNGVQQNISQSKDSPPQDNGPPTVRRSVINTDPILGGSLAVSSGSGSPSTNASSNPPSGSGSGSGTGSATGTGSGSGTGTGSGSSTGTGTGSGTGSGAVGPDWSPYGLPVFGIDDPFLYKGGITGFVSPLSRLPEPPEVSQIL